MHMVVIILKTTNKMEGQRKAACLTNVLYKNLPVQRKYKHYIELTMLTDCMWSYEHDHYETGQ